MSTLHPDVRPVAGLVDAAGVDAAGVAGPTVPSGWSRPSWVRMPRPTAVLAPTLPALLLLGVCVAGLSDPPDAPAPGTGAVSRLHVPTQAR